MALEPDDTVCYCFHVSLRKVETFCKINKPQAASQISDCLSAGTGCGWCVPMLKHVHKKCCGENIPWWRKIPAESNLEGTTNAAPAITTPTTPTAPVIDDSIDAEAYKAGRAQYIKAGKGTPPKDS